MKVVLGFAKHNRFGVKFQEVPVVKTRVTKPMPLLQSNMNMFKDVQISEPFNAETLTHLKQMRSWTVFTDGSTKIPTANCGWGAIIVIKLSQFRINSCIAFGGPVGVVNNYAAELMAILAVCELAPPRNKNQNHN